MSYFNRRTLLTLLSLVITAFLIGPALLRTARSLNPLHPADAAAVNPTEQATAIPTVAITVTVQPTAVSATPVLATPTPPPQQRMVSRSINGLNLRAEPGGTILATLSGGTTVRLTGGRQTSGGQGWAEVIDPSGRRGWVVESYLVPVAQ